MERLIRKKNPKNNQTKDVRIKSIAGISDINMNEFYSVLDTKLMLG